MSRKRKPGERQGHKRNTGNNRTSVLAAVGVAIGLVAGTAAYTLLSRMQMNRSSLTSISPTMNQATAMTSSPVSSSVPPSVSTSPVAPSPILPFPLPPASKTATDPNAKLINISAVGDLIPGSNASGSPLPSEPGEALAQEAQVLFGRIKPFLGEADITFGNFESTLTNHPYSTKAGLGGAMVAFRTPPVYAQMLKEMGFDVLSIANNHSYDFGDEGLAETIATIEQNGMKAVGEKEKIVYTKVKGVTIAWIGYTYFPEHNDMNNLEAAAKLMQEANQNADLVVISVHAGAEGSDQIYTRDRTEYLGGENRGNMVQFSRFMIDQGADLILGHGPHVPRALELYKDRLIAYSLGNFMGYGTLSTYGALGDSMVLQVQMDSQGQFVAGRVLPVALDRYGIPYLDDYFQSVILVRNLIKSDFPNTPITLDDMGYIVRTDR
ncbi:CapA family protein [Leptolyngbya ohadii]|uniref:CapA family protein n=1 Tax=Leptolyngbya ohadii TaxID=1962290 RepID=UPI0019D49A71|nr:CapA family protein [Leptolyngbya ohadii]